MKNPNTTAVLTFAEKHATLHQSGTLYVPMVVHSYSAEDDTFSIGADTRYMSDYDLGECGDTAFYDIDDFTIPSLAIYAITGADTDFEDYNDWAGHFFLMPGSPVNAK